MGKYVERFDTKERILHWFVAASFFTLLLSGLGLYSRLFHGYFDLFGGAGWSVMQLRHVHLGGSLTGGVRLYGWHSKNGFSNDLFPTTGFAQTQVELQYRP